MIVLYTPDTCFSDLEIKISYGLVSGEIGAFDIKIIPR